MNERFFKMDERFESSLKSARDMLKQSSEKHRAILEAIRSVSAKKYCVYDAVNGSFPEITSVGIVKGFLRLIFSRCECHSRGPFRTASFRPLMDRSIWKC